MNGKLDQRKCPRRKIEDDIYKKLETLKVFMVGHLHEKLGP